MRSRRAGFTLLEVVIALSILGVALYVLVATQATAVVQTLDSRKILTGTYLAQQQMTEALLRLEKEGFTTADVEEEEQKTRFAGLDMPGFEAKVPLPGNSAWGFVYTPQYPEPQVWHEKKEDEPPQIVYSYVFANGEAEYAVIRIVNQDDPEDGYSIEVEPVSGNVRVESDLIEVGKSLSWLPTEAPTIR